MTINKVDICIGLCWGDEGKGKLVTELIKKQNYDLVCRWNGSSNAGHTIYIDGIKYHTHLIPSGVFYDIPSIIGPDCYINEKDFKDEIKYLNSSGFNTNIIKISPNAHIVKDEHIKEDQINKKSNNSTGKGIAPCSGDKFKRNGTILKDCDSSFLKQYMWDECLHGNILCEGAQGFWLDVNYGDYPYVTSSYTLPFSSCSLGFPTQKINNIYGAAKIYDTRVGTDPYFDNDTFDLEILKDIAIKGNEYGTTTGRPRKVKWLNLDKLLKSINISGTTHVIVSKIDIFSDLEVFKLFYENKYIEFNNLIDMISFIEKIIKDNCIYVKKVIFSDNPKTINNL